MALPGRAATDPLEVYGSLPSLDDVSISPLGTRLAFVRAQGEALVLAVQSLEDRKVVAALNLGENKFRHVEWADEGHLLIYTSVTQELRTVSVGESEWFQARLWDIATSRLTPVPDPDQIGGHFAVMNSVQGALRLRNVDGRVVIFTRASAAFGSWIQGMLVRVDVATGKHLVVPEPEGLKGGLADQWAIDSQGRIVAERVVAFNHRTCYLRGLVGGAWKVLAEDNDDSGIGCRVPSPMGLVKEGRSLLVDHREGDLTVFHSYSLQDGSDEDLVDHIGDLDEMIFDRLNGVLMGGYRLEDDRRYRFFTERHRANWSAVERAFEGAHLRLSSFTDDFSRLVVRVDAPGKGLLYYLVDFAARKTTPLGLVYEGIDAPIPVRRIDYTAADSLPIGAYLTLPPGRPEHGLPLVVLPHGGPIARDSAEFDWMSQALAYEGYAVLQPNFRGSDLDSKFVRASYGEWGRKMQTDLSDGIRYLVSQGIVDPTRVCIVGLSYGGYAALAAVTLDPAPYRCAVSVAGISNLEGFLEWTSDETGRNSSSETRYWKRLMGVKSSDASSLKQVSPIEHVDAVRVPVLLIHATDDTVVPISQSIDFFRALTFSDKPVQMVRLKGEDHWLSRSASRLATLRAVVNFLLVNNPPGPSTAATPETRSKPADPGGSGHEGAIARP